MRGVVKYILPLDLNVRKRHYHRVEKRKIKEFTIQLEALVGGRWMPIIRYDCAHGFSHVDIFNLKGKRVDKIPLQMDFNEALTFAERDLDRKWREYVEDFFRGKKIK